MNNVIQFPTEFVRDKAKIEKIFEEGLAITPLDEDSKIELKRRLISAWEKHYCKISIPFSFSLPDSITQPEIEAINSSILASVNLFNRFLNDHLNLLLTERYALEHKLFLKERGL